jgi:hypothetical protein
MTGIVEHSKCHILIASVVCSTPSEFLSVTNGNMGGNVVNSVDDLRWNFVVTSDLVYKIPHGIVIDNY